MRTSRKVLIIGVSLLIVSSGCLSFLQNPSYNCSETPEGPEKNRNSVLSPPVRLTPINAFTDDSTGVQPYSPPSPPADQEGEKESENKNTSIDVSGGELKVEPEKVFERVEKIIGVNAEPPELIIARESRYSGQAGSATVTIRPNMSKRQTELVLAHEFAHIIQEEKYPTSELREKVVSEDRSPTMDQKLVIRTVVEGTAEYVEQSYADMYLEGAREKRLYERSTDVPCKSPYDRYFFSAYHIGYRYIDGRIESAAQIGELYEDPPRTTEQILKEVSNPETGVSRTHTQTANLSVQVNDSTRWSYGYGSEKEHETVGELLLRITLQTRLNDSFSIKAADGWGNDRLVQFNDVKYGTHSYAWVIRTDTPEDADELEKAFEEFGRSERLNYMRKPRESPSLSFSDVLWEKDLPLKTQRMSDDILVVFAGSRDFHDAVSVGFSQEYGIKIVTRK